MGRVITGCEVRHPAVVRHPDAPHLCERVTGRRIEALRRRGKYMFFDLGEAEELVIHLGMTGQLRLVRPEVPLLSHTHVIFGLDDGNALRFRDIRRFGRVLAGTERELIAEHKLPRLGPEPIDPDFSARDLRTRIRGRTAPIKSLLLDQAIVAGVGNIYADEALFGARVHPARAAGSLSAPAV